MQSILRLNLRLHLCSQSNSDCQETGWTRLWERFRSGEWVTWIVPGSRLARKIWERIRGSQGRYCLFPLYFPPLFRFPSCPFLRIFFTLGQRARVTAVSFDCIRNRRWPRSRAFHMHYDETYSWSSYSKQHHRPGIFRPCVRDHHSKDEITTDMAALHSKTWSHHPFRHTHKSRCADASFVDLSFTGYGLLCGRGFLVLWNMPLADLHFVHPNSSRCSLLG